MPLTQYPLFVNGNTFGQFVVNDPQTPTVWAIYLGSSHYGPYRFIFGPDQGSATVRPRIRTSEHAEIEMTDSTYFLSTMDTLPIPIEDSSNDKYFMCFGEVSFDSNNNIRLNATITHRTYTSTAVTMNDAPVRHDTDGEDAQMIASGGGTPVDIPTAAAQGA